MNYVDNASTNERLSLKFRMVSLWAMCAVVLIHSNTLGTLPEPSAWNVIVQKIFTRSFTAWAVPFFFLMSGFWFACGSYVTSDVLRGGVFAVKKIKSLLLPYILWAIIGAFAGMPLILFNNHVTGKALFERTFLEPPGIWAKLDLLFGITANGPCGNLALWYVRTLLILFLAAPLWKMALRRCRVVVTVVAVGCIVLCPEWVFPLLCVKMSSVGWFLLGASAAEWLCSPVRLSWWAVTAFGLAWSALSVASACGHEVMPQLIPVFGIAFLWFGYDLAAKWLGEPQPWMRKTFWIYCMHGPIMGYWLSGGLYVLGKSDVVALALMMTGPLYALLVCLTFSILVQRLMPSFYALLTGGRGVEKKKEA